MKKTTYSKSFTGWAQKKEDAQAFWNLGGMPNLKYECGLYSSKREAAKELLAPELRKVKVTYTVTVEPV